MEASRYPDDYDAVLAGAPARRYLEIITQITVYNQVSKGPGGAGLASKTKLVHDAILGRCDALDGVKDGVLENPRSCHFDLAELQCKGADSPTCLTLDEVAAYRKIHTGPRLRNGEQVINGPSLGTEGVPDWGAWITSPTAAVIGQEFHRWFVYGDPTWKVDGFDLDRDYPEARKRIASVIDADSTDLRAFTQRGGKLLIYQGWSDPAITAEDTLAFYDRARRTVGSKAAEQVKLFMVPGMGHCTGGPGPYQFDMQPVLERWVEQGETPVRVVAIHPGSAETAFSRPLCAWPMTARYNGSGSDKDAGNFICRAAGRR
jgi:feruloyl esterase